MAGHVLPRILGRGRELTRRCVRIGFFLILSCAVGLCGSVLLVGLFLALHQKGFSVLLFDFQSHGESPGRGIMFGWLEALDAAAAVAFVRTRLPNASPPLAFPQAICAPYIVSI